MEQKYTGQVSQNSHPVFPTQDFSVPPPIAASFVEARPERRTENYRRKSRSKSREKSRKRSRSRSREHNKPSGSRDYRSTSRSTYSSKYDRDSRGYRSYHRRSRSKDRKSPYKSRESSYRRSPHRDQRQESRSRQKSESTSRQRPPPKERSERERLLEKWRKNYCETSEQIAKKLQELADDDEQVSWIRSSPADIYYNRVKDNTVEATPRLDALCKLFDEELQQRADKIKSNLPPYKPPDRRRRIRVCKHKCEFKLIYFKS